MPPFGTGSHHELTFTDARRVVSRLHGRKTLVGKMNLFPGGAFLGIRGGAFARLKTQKCLDPVPNN